MNGTKRVSGGLWLAVMIATSGCLDGRCPVGLARDAAGVCVVRSSAGPPGSPGAEGEGGAGSGGAGGQGGRRGEQAAVIRGVVLDTAGSPVGGVPVSLTTPGRPIAIRSILTRTDGSFTMTAQVASGATSMRLRFDGAHAASGVQFPVVQRQVAVVGGQATRLPVVYLPPLNRGLDLSGQPGLVVTPAPAGTSVSAPGGLVVSFPERGGPSVVGLPATGVALDSTSPSETVVSFPSNTTISFPAGTAPSVSLTGIPGDRPPFDLAGSAASEIVTLEPSGARLSGALSVSLPNRDRLAPGTSLDLYAIDPATGQPRRWPGARPGGHDAKVLFVCVDPTDDADPPAGPPCPRSGCRLTNGGRGPCVMPARAVSSRGDRRALARRRGGASNAAEPVTRIRSLGDRTLDQLGGIFVACPPTEVTGRIVDGAGAPLAGATVRFATPEGEDDVSLSQVTTRTDGEGRFAQSIAGCRLRVLVEKITDASNPSAPLVEIGSFPAENAADETVEASSIRGITVRTRPHRLVNVVARLRTGGAGVRAPLRITPCTETRRGQCHATALRVSPGAPLDAPVELPSEQGLVTVQNGALALAVFESVAVPVPEDRPGDGPGSFAGAPVLLQIGVDPLAQEELGLPDLPPVTLDASIAFDPAFVDPGRPATQRSEPASGSLCVDLEAERGLGSPQIVSVGAPSGQGTVRLRVRGFVPGNSRVFQRIGDFDVPLDATPFDVLGSETLLDVLLAGPGDARGVAEVFLRTCATDSPVPPDLLCRKPDHQDDADPGPESSRAPLSLDAVACAPGRSLVRSSVAPIPVPRDSALAGPSPGQGPALLVSGLPGGFGKLLGQRRLVVVGDAGVTLHELGCSESGCGATALASSPDSVGTRWDASLLPDGRLALLGPTDLLLLQPQGGTLVAAAPVALDRELGPSARLLAADLDGDGVTDLVVVGGGADLLLRGDYQTGGFSVTTLGAAAPVLGGALLPLDPAGTGLLLVELAATGALQLETLVGPGLASRVLAPPAHLASAFPELLTMGTLQAGFSAVVQLARSDGTAAAWLVASDGAGALTDQGVLAFESAQALATGVSGLTTARGAPFDVDEDVDLLLGLGDGVTVLEQSGGGFHGTGIVPLGTAPVQIVSEDLDDDGRPDLVSLQAASTEGFFALAPSPGLVPLEAVLVSRAGPPEPDRRPGITSLFPAHAGPCAEGTVVPDRELVLTGLDLPADARVGFFDFLSGQRVEATAYGERTAGQLRVLPPASLADQGAFVPLVVTVAGADPDGLPVSTERFAIAIAGLLGCTAEDYQQVLEDGASDP